MMSNIKSHTFLLQGHGSTKAGDFIECQKDQLSSTMVFRERDLMKTRQYDSETLPSCHDVPFSVSYARLMDGILDTRYIFFHKLLYDGNTLLTSDTSLLYSNIYIFLCLVYL
jgi:hypothetical protein